MWEFICYSSSFDSNYYMCITIYLGNSNHQQMGDNTLQLSLVTQSCCPTLCDPMDCNMPGFPVHHQLLELTQKLMSIDSVMPSNHLILCCPLLLPPLVFPSIRVFSNESVLQIRWPKY